MPASIPAGFMSVGTAKGLTPGSSRASIIALVVDVLPPKSSGTGTFMSTFTIKDGDLDSEPWKGLKIRFVKNSEAEVPAPQIGDVILVRNIPINHFNNQIIGVSAFRLSTPWIIFKKGSGLNGRTSLICHPPDTRATQAEASHAASLLGCKIPEAASAVSVPAAITPKTTLASTTSRGRKFTLIKDVTCDTFVDLIGQVVKTFPEDYNRFMLYITDYTTNNLLYTQQPPSDTANFGRDGDEFGYISHARRQWPGPYGQMTIQVTLWHPHCQYARSNVKENDFVLLENVRVKPGRDSGIEGNIHTDRIYPEKVTARVIHDNENDPRVKALVKRKIEYWKQMKAGGSNNDEPKDQSTRNKKKKKPPNQKEKQEDKKTQQVENRLKPAIPTRAKHDELNAHVRANKPTVPCSPLSSILHNESHNNTSPDGIEYRLPFQNLQYRSSIRVVDFFPPNLEDFAVRYDVESAMLSDAESVDEHDDDDGEGESAMRRRRWRWEWRFCLLVEDGKPRLRANPGEERERMQLFVAEADAVFLLQMDAVNLRKDPRSLGQLREKLFILWGDLEERKAAKGDDDAFNEDDRKASTAPPFVCCIKEYGVKVEVDSEMQENDDAEDDMLMPSLGWERRFRMFGTTIL
ncbi:hypothetical protein AJ80_08958 [Polytolypa hystricis UAMH7299]|uniref:Protection of telomeres protein 1 n=1 Tax=Polytolypa hystricis (strain UAMH7299) TaxID=1447883 RepID=A0A2B7WZ73_POLH7|nr:hypothetical protein AJ80_08958 [Polytolypa hystricis UAMH7299]